MFARFASITARLKENMMKTEIQLKDKIAYLLTRNHQTQKIERAALIILDRN